MYQIKRLVLENPWKFKIKIQFLEFWRKFQVKIQYFKKNGFLIFNSILSNLCHTSFFIWGITFHNLKYLAKPIKCIKMRANIKSVGKLMRFSFVFSLIFKIGIFFHIPQFWRKMFFGYFKSPIFKCLNHIKILPHVLGHRKPSGQSNKRKLLYRSSWNTLYD